jgi:hypothetical protein
MEAPAQQRAGAFYSTVATIFRAKELPIATPIPFRQKAP